MKYLVTGAGGSIGSEIVRRLVGADKVVLVGHSETAIYAINQEAPRSIPVIADIRDLKRMRDVFLEHEPDVVFHAAAVKHVPLAEKFPGEAIQTNIIGTRNVCIASQMVGARMVFISTDKAVYPSSVMGKTKRIAELYCRTHDNVKVVRFGNVLESSGSVIPLFRKQIEAGGPVTVTHPAMVRYFMEIGEAANLAIFAGHATAANSLFFPQMQKRRIVDIAKNMIGAANIEIAYTGLRAGEKLDEKLLYDSEPDIAQHPDSGAHISDIEYRDPIELNRAITKLERGDHSALETFFYG